MSKGQGQEVQAKGHHHKGSCCPLSYVAVYPLKVNTRKENAHGQLDGQRVTDLGAPRTDVSPSAVRCHLRRWPGA